MCLHSSLSYLCLVFIVCICCFFVFYGPCCVIQINKINILNQSVYSVILYTRDIINKRQTPNTGAKISVHTSQTRK